MQLHRDTTVQSLTVTPTLKDGIISFEDSPIVKAVKHGRVLVLDVRKCAAFDSVLHVIPFSVVTESLVSFPIVMHMSHDRKLTRHPLRSWWC